VTDEQTVDDLLARLERERLTADRLYNKALTAVDQAIQTLPSLPPAPAAYDPSRLGEANAEWRILPDGPPSFDGSLKGRLGRMVWRLIGPALERQQRFNAALVDHLNRNVRAHEEMARSVTGMLDALARELAALVRFESLLVQYLQSITAYVDSKDRSLGGVELRERLALTEQRLLALKRSVERAAATPPATPTPAETTAPARTPAPGRTAPPGAAGPFAGTVDSLTYVGFEDQFRGSQDEIRRRVEDYVPILAAATDIVDIGCGRGELLALLHERGVRARGVDVNAAMVQLCRERGFQAEEGDALSFLERQEDGSIGGLVAVQVVEHFEPAYLTAFLASAFHKMRPGAPLILETINPACWMAFFETYIRDLTHQQPLHPDTLRYLVQASGFSRADVQFRSPVSGEDRLDRIELPDAPGEALGGVAAALNDHADKLNRRLFSFMDYVVVARR
jgi:SAM-dependent methyltransferase